MKKQKPHARLRRERRRPACNVRAVALIVALIGLMSWIALRLASTTMTASVKHSTFGSISSAPAQENPMTLNRWSSNGPDGGQVLSLAIDRSNSATIYAGAGGGVFKSTNGGESWTASLSPDYNHETYTLVIDPISSTTVYAAGNFGVSKSPDGGASWHAINNGLANQYGNTVV